MIWKHFISTFQESWIHNLYTYMTLNKVVIPQFHSALTVCFDKKLYHGSANINMWDEFISPGSLYPMRTKGHSAVQSVQSSTISLLSNYTETVCSCSVMLTLLTFRLLWKKRNLRAIIRKTVGMWKGLIQKQLVLLI